MGLPEISRVTWQVWSMSCTYCTCRCGPGTLWGMSICRASIQHVGRGTHPPHRTPHPGLPWELKHTNIDTNRNVDTESEHTVVMDSHMNMRACDFMYMKICPLGYTQISQSETSEFFQILLSSYLSDHDNSTKILSYSKFETNQVICIHSPNVTTYFELKYQSGHIWHIFTYLYILTIEWSFSQTASETCKIYSQHDASLAKKPSLQRQ